MNLGNEVIVKNFHVLNGVKSTTEGSGQSAVTTVVEPDVLAKKKDGHVHFLVREKTTVGSNAATYGDTELTTDQFCLDWIKHVRLTKPASPAFKKWEITAPGLSIDSGDHKLLTVYMHFTNLFGYGIADRWEKFATISVENGTTKKQIAFDLAERINAQYIHGMKPVVAKAYDVTTSSNTYTQITTRPTTSDASGHAYKVVIEDNTFAIQTPTRRRMERNMDPQPVQMTITTNILEGENSSWAVEVKTANDKQTAYAGVVDTSKTYKNAYLIWGLEKVSQLNSTESMGDPCTGFIGYDSVMDGLIDSEMNPTSGHNYWVLDIAYETLPKMGVPSGRNLKELSFAAPEASSNTVPTVLTSILTALGLQYNSTTHQVEPTSANVSANTVG